MNKYSIATALYGSGGSGAQYWNGTAWKNWTNGTTVTTQYAQIYVYQAASFSTFLESAEVGYNSYPNTLPSISAATVVSESGQSASVNLATAMSALNLDANGVSWSYTGTMPTGLNLSSSGVLSGSAASSGSIQVSVTDDRGYASVPQTLTIYAYPQVVITTAPQSATVYAGDSTAKTNTPEASGGRSGSLTWVLASGSGALPGGMTLNATTGVISGTPTTAATYSNIVLEAEDTTYPTTFYAIASPITITVAAVASPLVDLKLSEVHSGVTFNGALLSQNPTATTWAWGSSSPSGVAAPTITGNKSASAAFSGTAPSPASLTTYVLTFDAGSTPATANLTVDPTPLALNVPTASLYMAPGQQVSMNVDTPAAGAAVGTLTYSMYNYSSLTTLQSACPGLSVVNSNDGTNTAQIVGQVTSTCTDGAMVLKATDVDGTTATTGANYVTLNVDSQIAITTAPASATGAHGSSLSTNTPAATGGRGSSHYTWVLASGSGALPGGMTLNATTGVISGAPTTAATYSNIVLEVEDPTYPTTFYAIAAPITITVN